MKKLLALMLLGLFCGCASMSEISDLFRKIDECYYTLWARGSEANAIHVRGSGKGSSIEIMTFSYDPAVITLYAGSYFTADASKSTRLVNLQIVEADDLRQSLQDSLEAKKASILHAAVEKRLQLGLAIE